MRLSALGPTDPERRTQLTRERVMAAAIELADRDGIESISMRKLAQELGVEAMSLYTHVRNKNDLLAGMTDAVIRQIPISADGADWKASLRQLVFAARSVMLRHPWAPRTVETQTAPGPAVLQYVNTVLGILREGGFSIAQTHHALHILGSRLLGFTQALFDDSGDLEPEERLTASPGAPTSPSPPARPRLGNPVRTCGEPRRPCPLPLPGLPGPPSFIDRCTWPVTRIGAGS